MENTPNNPFFCYIKRKWSKDFDLLKSELLEIEGVYFEIDEKDRFLISIPNNALEKVSPLLQQSVITSAWHDVVNAEIAYVIFETSAHKLDINVGAENAVWQKMKSLEEGVRKFNTLKEMIADSMYGQYIRY